MSANERTGTRSLMFSAWHRSCSIRRFLPEAFANVQDACDIDLLEYDHRTKAPLVLIKTAVDSGAPPRKTAEAMGRLAQRADLPALIVLCTPAEQPNPADARVSDIASFRVRRIWPKPEDKWRTYTPQDFADFLWRLREWSRGRSKPPH